MTTRVNDAIAMTQIVPTQSGNYTAKGEDTIILMNTGAARTVSTDASIHIEGRRLTIKDAAGAGAATNNITFDPAGSTLVDGATTKAITTNRGALEVVFAGGAWHSV